MNFTDYIHTFNTFKFQNKIQVVQTGTLYVNMVTFGLKSSIECCLTNSSVEIVMLITK